MFEKPAYEELERRILELEQSELKLKKAETRLREGEERFKTIFEGSRDAIFIADRDARFAQVNPAACALTGYTEKELLEMRIPDLHAPEDLQAFDLYFDRIMAGEAISSIADILCRDGSKVCAEFSNTRVSIGGSQYMHTVARDITERKQAEDALAGSEDKYRRFYSLLRLMCDNVPDLIWAKDLDARFVFVNQAMCDKLIVCDRPETALGKTDMYFAERQRKAGYTHTFGEKCVDSDAIVTRERAPGRFLEDGFVRNEYLVLDVHKAPFFNDDGQMIGTVGCGRDVTERKAIEAQLFQARKMESIGTLAGGIAHDFNNILYLITGNVELALDDISVSNPAYANLEEIKSASFRAAGIVKQLLNFSRKTDQQLKPIGAVSVIRDALKFLRSTIPTTIEIRMQLPGEEVTIFADPIQINQVLMNICTNAYQEMEMTGGTMDIDVAAVNLERGIEGRPDLAPGAYLRISVSDTGQGIEPENIDRIFDPYYTTKEVGKGSGIGLAVVLGIVKNHGGAISVDSRPGSGATFTVHFPIIHEKHVSELETPGKTPSGTERILFVDDEEKIAVMAQKILERLGYTAHIKTNPDEALALFESNPGAFDLVITDMTMPQMTGTMLLKKLKEIRADIPVVICTGYSDLVDQEKAEKLDAGYIVKPIAKGDIADTIRKVLDKAKPPSRP